jgi:hypothetical protein
MSTTIKMTFLDYLVKENGYLDPKDLGDGRYACVAPFIFTHAIIVGRMGNVASYDDRWCYANYRLAKAALDTWDGVGEPEGWHRHPASGRRRDEEGIEYVNR